MDANELTRPQGFRMACPQCEWSDVRTKDAHAPCPECNGAVITAGGWAHVMVEEVKTSRE